MCLLDQEEANLAPGWRYCIVSQDDGDRSCHQPMPPGEPPSYSEKFTFYRRDEAGPRCDPCICLPSVPAVCEAKVSAYSDRECSDGALIGTEEMAIGTGESCLHLRPGPALGSISAEWTLRELGVCRPKGGGPRPITVCCLPESEG